MRKLSTSTTRSIAWCMFLLFTIGASQMDARTPLERIVAESGPVEMSFNVEQSRMHTNAFHQYVSDYVVFDYNTQAARQIRDEQPTTLSMTVPTPDGDMTLTLVEHKITSPDYVIESSDGQIVIDKPLGIHYRGTVQGHEGSLAGASFFDGEISIFGSTREQGNFTINRTEVDGQARYISYFDRDLLIQDGFECHTEAPESIPEFLQDARQREDMLQRQGSDVCVRVHIEADFELYTSKQTVALTAAYIEGFFNNVKILYDNESLNAVISYIHVWNTQDPFTIPNGGGSGDAINKFQQYIATGANLNGDLGHLVALDQSGGYGGVARGIGVLCLNDASRLAYSDINNGYSNFPTYSWTVMVFTHEMGHNLGSPHTHGCYWNGNGTQIDDCGNIGQNPPEGQACYNRFGAIIPQNGGYIMSYCHLNTVGINFTLGFGQQSGDLIRTLTNGASCLTACPAGDGSCVPPYQLLVSNITETSATVTWTSAAGTSFEVRYGVDGNWTTMTVNGATTTTLTGLDSGTRYDVEVRTLCDGPDSEFVNNDFATLCDETFTLPYVELFDNSKWTVGSYEFDPCWKSVKSAANYGWSVESFETPSGNTGPDGDHTSGFGKYVYAEASFGANNQDAELITPPIDLGTSVGPFVSFWYHMFGANVNRLIIDISTNGGTSYSFLQQIVGQQQTALDDPWEQVLISLAAYEGQTVQLKFKARRGADFAGDIAIDDVIVADSSLVDVSVTSLTSPITGCGLGSAEAVTISVTNSGYQTLNSGTSVGLELNLNGSTVATENLVLASDLAPGESVNYTFAATLDLSAPEQYAVSVSTTLPTDEISGNNTRGANVVSKPIISVYPYTQSFESYTDWTSGGAENSWELGTPAKAIITGASDGSKAWVTGGLGIDTYNANEDSYVESPCFDFSNLGDPYIQFDVWWEIETIWEGATFEYSTDAGETWQTLGVKGDDWFNSDTITTLPGQDGWTGTDDGDNSFVGSGGWVTVTQDLTGLGENPSVLLRMHFVTDPFVQFDGIAFDNILVDGESLIPACYELEFAATTCDPGEAGTVVQVLQDEDGCDSVITTVTTLLPSYDLNFEVYTCDPDEVGTDVQSLTTVAGCDSTITTETILAPSYDIELNATSCDPDDVGTEVMNLTTSFGCDSTVTINTTLQEPYATLVEFTSCVSSSVGTSEETFTASDGCDSVVTTTVTFEPIEADFSFTANGGTYTFTNTSSSNSTSYAWTFGDGNTSTGENPTNSYTTNGTYEVVMIASAPGCDSDTHTVSITVVISGIDLLSFVESVNVFPNPSNGNFAVEINGGQAYRDLTFTLFSVAGSELDSRAIGFSSYTRQEYSLSELPDGMYFLRIRSGDEQATFKVNVLR